MSMFGWLRKINGKQAHGGNRARRNTPAQRDVTARPRLEQLEDRLAPATFNTATNVAINITPNIATATTTETLTATVRQAGTTTPVTSGNVAFNVNGHTGTAALNGSGQATFTTTLPLYAVATNQTVDAAFAGATVGADTFFSSNFFSPVYLNVLNAFLPSQINFGTPPTATTPPTFNSAFGETDAVSFFGRPIDFHYTDPGTITNFTALGFTFPRSTSATLFAPIESVVASSSGQLL
jgi:hypothetical protein